MYLRCPIGNKKKVGVRKILLKTDEISIDMLDFSFDINHFEFVETMKPVIEKYMINFDNRLEYWQSFKWNNYKHNWTWENLEYTLFFGYSLNISEKLKNRFYFSYNPNKVSSEDEILTFLITNMLYNIMSARLEKFDIAFDYLGIKTSDLIIDRSNKREYKYFQYSSGDPTIYLGSRKKDGFIKIYDKATEELKDSDVEKVSEKTRIEYTLKPKMPLLYYNEYKCITTMCTFNLQGVIGLYDDSNLSPKEKFLVYSIEHGYPIEKISWKDKKRYQEIMANKEQVYTEIKPSQVEVEKVIINLIREMFVEYNFITEIEKKQVEFFVKHNKE